MNFTDLGFLVFLPVALAVAYGLKGRHAAREWFLVAASWLFYSIWDPRFIVLLLALTGLSYAGALMLPLFHGRRRAWVLAGILVLCMAPLALFKYADFVLANLEALGVPVGGTRLDLLLPVGISFFTFHAVSYLCDVNAGKVAAEASFRRYALYIAFFPQLVAGPIVRAPDFLPQLHRPWRPPQARGAVLAINRFLWGLAKKVCIADPLAVSIVDPTFANLGQASGGAIILATFAFGLQIYADFSAYSDMALAVSRLFGFRLRENFRAPYMAVSFSDFWRRWHISLSTLIRDYLYIPLGGSRGVGRLRAAANAILAMLLCGLWHGAAWTFVLWGGLHGLALALARLAPAMTMVPGWLRLLAGWGITQAVAMALWFPFRATSFGDLSLAIQRIRDTGWLPYDFSRASLSVLLAAALILYAEQAVIRFWPGLVPRGAKLALLKASRPQMALSLALSLVILALVDPVLGGNSFIYFQF